MTRTETALATFDAGYNCAQSVVCAWRDALGSDPDTALRMASGFGAGMGRKQEVCGALSGGIMVLGARFGRGANAAREATEATYRWTGELMDRFRAAHGSVVCRQLLNNVDLVAPGGREQFHLQDLRRKVCRPCVATVVAELETMMG